MEYINCILCKSDNKFIVSHRGRDASPLRVVICKNCGLIYLNPRYSKEELQEMYREGAYAAKYRDSKGGKRINGVSERYVNNQIKKGRKIFNFVGSNLLDKSGGVLEIGSTAGGILSYFRDEGFLPVQGVDPESKYVNHANNVLEIPTAEGLFESFKSDREYSLIIARHVLEHTVNPIEILVKAREILSDNGLIYVEVPNLYSLNPAKNWYYNFMAEHLFIFTPNTMKMVANKAGFFIIHEDKTIGYRRDIRLVLKKDDLSEKKNPSADYWLYIVARGWIYHFSTPLRKLYFFIRKYIKNAK